MTLTSYPPAYSSINDNLVYVVYDANSIDPLLLNYKYVGEIWIDGVNVFTARVFPSPDGSFGIFNISAIVREYVYPTLKAEMIAGEWAIGVVLKIREEYDGAVGSVVLTDSERIFFNHYNGRIDDFTSLDDYADKVASNRSGTIDLFSTSINYYIPYFATTTTPFDVVINGITTTITPSEANTIQNVNIAVGATSDYTVIFPDKTFNVRVICEPLTKHYILHFLNKLGGFDSFSFSKTSKKKFGIERKAYQQLGYRVDGSGVVSVKSGAIMHEQKTMFGVRFTEKLSLNSDMLSDSDFVWLEELVFSPLVYLQDGETLYPIGISETNYEDKIYIADGLVNLSIDVEFGASHQTQYR
jgi:hypothetical protein